MIGMDGGTIGFSGAKSEWLEKAAAEHLQRHCSSRILMSNKSLFDLNGRVAIVTGGNGGIGLGMAAGMCEAGASIVIAARDRLKNQDAVSRLQSTGPAVAAVEIDVTDESSCRNMVQETLNRFGRIDILVNNAGINVRKQPQDLTPAEWH